MTLQELHQAFLQSGGICTDTRQDVRDTLFFALKGERFDGNRFVEKALMGGCRLAITEREELREEQRVVYTSSSLDLLQELAACHRAHISPRVLAITGSNGKTTTKELILAILSKRYRVLATRGNLNNHIGVPLTLLSLQDEELAVIEMGANHSGEIAALARIASPELGLITNVGKAHLEGFGSVAGVVDAKGELYEFLALNGGKAIVDGEDQVLMEKASSIGVETLKIGTGHELPVSGRILGQSPFLQVELLIRGETRRVETRLVGSYNLQNIRQAAAVGIHCGIPVQGILEAIANYIPENHRSQFVEGKGNRVTLDSYNANPTSMREAVSGLIGYASPPTMVILGDMAELGEAAMHEHRELVNWMISLPLERILLVGPLFSRVSEPSDRLAVFSSVRELESHLDGDPPEGFTILVKGSRVMELERIVKFL